MQISSPNSSSASSPSKTNRVIQLEAFRVFPLGKFLFFALVIAYLVPGLIGHDPWKQDETYIFGMIHHLLNTGDWVVPVVAGEPFMEKPPLYYWVGAGFARVFSPWLTLHDAARLATGFFMVITCVASAYAARLGWGKGTGRFAVLSLLGCLGTVLHSHMMLTDIPVLTGTAIALWGFLLIPQRAIAGGLLLGAGIGIGFLAKGVLAPGVIGLTALVLPLGFKNWRTRTYGIGLLTAFLAALPWLLIWPIALYLRSPALFMEWFWMNNVGRFFGFSVAVLGAPHERGFWWVTIPWFTFPVLPLALITVGRHRQKCLSMAVFQVSFLILAIFMAVLVVAASARANYALPLLAPLCVLAAPASIALSKKMDRYWDSMSRLFFGVLAALIWFVWAHKMLHGVPPEWPFITKHLPPDFAEHFSLSRCSVATIMTLLALCIWIRVPKIQARGLVSWVTGLTLFWGLLCMLWMPWLDYAKSYRSVFESMKMKLPAQYRCMESAGLGESEKAMLRYVLGINTLRREVVPHPHCDVFLIEGLAESPPQSIDSKQWKQVWEGARPGDTRERFWLFTAPKVVR